MLRRDLLKGMVAFSGACAVPMVAKAAGVPSASQSTQLINAKAKFNHALAAEPGLIGFANIEANFAPSKLKLEGKLPNDLKGVFYRNGPGKHERGEIRYQHLFEGDGMVQRFEIGNGEIHHFGRFLETAKYSAEQQAGAFLYAGPETKFKEKRASINSDSVNVANINTLSVGNDLWALWEAGSASKIDPDTLQYQGFVNLGAGSKYGDSLKGVPFSAHPKVDPTGDIWNFGLNHTGHIVLYHLSAMGKLQKAKLVDTGYKGRMLHDFLTTESHVLLILPSLKSNGSRNDRRNGFFSQIAFDKNLPLRVMVLKKSDFSLVKEYELPPGFVFHFGNAWEDKSGVIRFDASLYPNIEVLQDMSNMMTGDLSHGHTNSKLALYELYPNGKTKHFVSDIYSEFPKVFAQQQTKRNAKLYHLSTLKNKIWNDTVCSYHLDTGKQDVFCMGPDFHVEEHIPIAPKHSKNSYLLGTALHVPSKRTCVNVFNAQCINQGPIARAWLPHHLPLGFHGNFVAAN